jgi:hypothetical protein
MLSGDLEQLLLADGLNPTVLQPSVQRSVGTLGIAIERIKSRGASVKHDPVTVNWYHGSISNITKSMRRQWKNDADEIIPIDQAAAVAFNNLTA